MPVTRHVTVGRAPREGGEEMEGGRVLHLSGESGAAFTAPGYGLCYRLHFFPPSKRK